MVAALDRVAAAVPWRTQSFRSTAAGMLLLEAGFCEGPDASLPFSDDTFLYTELDATVPVRASVPPPACALHSSMMMRHPQGSPIHLTFGRFHNQLCQANALHHALTCNLSTERVQSYISRRIQQTMLICQLLNVW